MLKKCLKYDLGSFWRLFALIAGTILAMAPFVGVLLRSFLLRLETMKFPWELFLVAAYAFLLPIFLFVCTLMVYIRYYMHFFKDEGYLTFTLPVKRSTLLCSKVLTAMIYQVASFAVVTVAIVIVLAIAPYTGDAYHTLLGAALTPVCHRIGEALATNFFFTIFKAFTGILLAVFVMLFNHLFYYLAMTLGSSINRKHPLLFCILLIYGFQTILSLLSTPLIMVLSTWTVAATQLFPLAFAGNLGNCTLWLFLFSIAVILALSCTALWQWVLHILERRLNLA